MMNRRTSLVVLPLLLLTYFMVICTGQPRRLEMSARQKFTAPSDTTASTDLRSLHRELRLDYENCNSTKRLELESREVGIEDTSARVRRWIHNAAVLTECPDITMPFKHDDVVPMILHRIWECDEIPKQYDEPIQSWIQHYSGGYVALWTRELRETFILQKHGVLGVQLYRRLVPGAYRADLFRYVIMFHVGGLYSDLDSTLQLALLHIDSLFHGVTTSVDLDATRLLNGAILMSPPKSCLFLCALGEVFDHSERREQFASDLDVSGPGVLGECLRHIVGRDSIAFDANVTNELNEYGYRVLKSEFTADRKQHIVRLVNGSVLVSLEPGGKGYARNE